MFINRTHISDFSNACLEAVGVPSEEAQIVTDVMLEADIREIHSHGLLRLPTYVERLQKNLMRNKALITVENQTSAITLLDGHGSIGQVVAHEAMLQSIKQAEDTGIGLVTAKNSNHFSIASHFSMMAAEKGMIGIVLSNTAPLMPAVGGAEKVIGNNPLSIASPSDQNDCIVLDMALSNSAFGKILDAQARNKKIPDDWGLNKRGLPTTNPGEVIDGGMLLPVGGAKGFGLALMIEILTGLLSGGQYSKLIPSMYNMETEQSISHTMISIDVKKFLDIELFYAHLNELISFVKATKKSPHTDEIYLPGEIEYLKAEQNERRGIPINNELLQSLNNLANKLNVRKIEA